MVVTQYILQSNMTNYNETLLRQSMSQIRFLWTILILYVPKNNIIRNVAHS